MSNPRFIELSSSYRNRAQYKSPSSFHVPFTNQGSASTLTLPFGTYTNGSGSTSTLFQIQNNALDTVTNGIIDYFFVSASDTGIATALSTTSATLSSSYPNYVNETGATITICVLGTQTVIGTSVILTSTYISAGISTVTFNTIPSLVTSQNYTYFIQGVGTTTLANAVVLPLVDLNGIKVKLFEQWYLNYYLIDETVSNGGTIVSSLIVSYDNITQTITLQNPINVFGHTYSIRQTLYNWVGTTVSGPSLPLTLLNSSPSITLTTSCIFLPNSASSSDNVYNGMYIYVSSTSCFLITSYVGQYRACFVTSIGTSATPIPIGTTIYLVSFLRDNYVPLSYNGSTVSQDQLVAYEVGLTSITLPNIIHSEYSYLYVEFLALSSYNQNIIYSNNPLSRNALFIIPIKDLTNPSDSPFVKLRARGMTQTIKFRPNDTMKFSVYLPTGELFQTPFEETYSPAPPNPFCQIDAVFSIQRLTGVDDNY